VPKSGLRLGGPNPGRGRGVAVLEERDRDVEARTNAVPEHERPTEMGDELTAHDRAAFVAVAVVNDERLVRVAPHDARRGAQMAPQVERIAGKPLATPLRRIEAIELEAGRGLRASRLGEQN